VNLDRVVPWRSLGVLLALSGCLILTTACPRPVPPDHGLVVVPADRWPLLVDDLEGESFKEASERSVAYLETLSPTQPLRFGPATLGPRKLIDGLRRLQELILEVRDPVALTNAIGREFDLLQSLGRDSRGEVLYTGYYEPILQARREPGPTHSYPVYAVPEDLVTVELGAFAVGVQDRRLVGRLEGRRVVPYPDREAIDFAGALEGRAEVLGYLTDPVEVFFLHVQGSGQLHFASGERLRAGYAISNGRPYRSIGRLLLDQGLMTADEMSMQAIKAFLAANPDQVRRVLGHNPSYVFFRPLPVDDGPLGCYELPLTAGRSIATDRSLYPAPIAAFVRGNLPTVNGGMAPLERFVLNQDTGGAIRGPGRVDLYFGSGDRAGELAGRTKHLGELYFLLPKGWDAEP
jgi:membrane-bound lytic murein transglycosylase A